MEDSDPSTTFSKTENSKNHRFPISLPIAETIENVHACSYLPNLSANLPLKLPGRILTPEEFDSVLASGIRRSGIFLYHTDCATCNACEPSRIKVEHFVVRNSFRRVLNKGNRELEMRVQLPILDQQHVELFNLHRSQRGLGEADQEYHPTDYENFLVDTCCPHTLELNFWHREELVGVSIIDCGKNSLSAVYTFFSPQYSKLSIGTYSILKQIEFAAQSEREYVYLGLYVEQNQHLNYKARFTPQERYIEGKWVNFPDPSKGTNSGGF